MTEQEAIQLLNKYKEGECTAEELVLIQNWYNELEGSLPEPDSKPDFEAVQERVSARLNIQGDIRQQSPEPSGGFKISWKIAAAAVFILVSGMAYFLFRQDGNTDHRPEVISVTHDIPAGSNKATLTLANGQQILLDEANTGAIANQGDVSITKNASGQIVYDASAKQRDPDRPSSATAQIANDSKGAEAAIPYNTIATPNGGQYQIILPDGSKVFLNAASSLKYPVSFAGGKREVVLHGEGYFEIAKDPRKPFTVLSSGQSIRVLGTHFNVSSYDKEPIVTTLLEGKIEISYPSFPQKAILKPGDQSTAGAAGFSIEKVDPEDAAAWKDGLFVFTNTDLKEVFKLLSRWYGVEVDYASIPAMNYVGEIPRKESLLNVLKLIEISSNVKFKLEGRRIMRK